jgi:hypothetical protein
VVRPNAPTGRGVVESFGGEGLSSRVSPSCLLRAFVVRPITAGVTSRWRPTPPAAADHPPSSAPLDRHRGVHKARRHNGHLRARRCGGEQVGSNATVRRAAFDPTSSRGRAERARRPALGRGWSAARQGGGRPGEVTSGGRASTKARRHEGPHVVAADRSSGVERPGSGADVAVVLTLEDRGEGCAVDLDHQAFVPSWFVRTPDGARGGREFRGEGLSSRVSPSCLRAFVPSWFVRSPRWSPPAGDPTPPPPPTPPRAQRRSTVTVASTSTSRRREVAPSGQVTCSTATRSASPRPRCTSGGPPDA